MGDAPGRLIRVIFQAVTKSLTFDIFDPSTLLYERRFLGSEGSRISYVVSVKVITTLRAGFIWCILWSVPDYKYLTQHRIKYKPNFSINDF